MAQATGNGSSEKKGLSPLAWVAIGCGGLVVIVLLVVVLGGMFAVKKGKELVAEMEENPAAFAERIINMNPDLEVTGRDDEAGTLTILNKKTGESMTVDYQDIREGKLSFESSDGESVSFDAQGEEGTLKVVTDEGEATWGAGSSEAPDWVPRLPGATRSESLMHQRTQGTESGVMVQWTSDDPEAVMAAVEALLQQEGYEVSKFTSSASAAEAGAPTGAVNGVAEELGRTVSVSVGPEDGETRVNITYSQKPKTP